MCGPSTLHLLSSSLSVCHFIPPLPLLSISLPLPPLAPSLFIFSPNLSIRSVDKLFMPLSVPEALSPLLHSPAPLLPLFCCPHPFLPLWPPPLIISSLRSSSSSFSVSSSLVLQKAQPHTIYHKKLKWYELLKIFKMIPATLSNPLGFVPNQSNTTPT